jgi:phage gp45-like
MHRATPLNTSFRAYTSGGARSAVHEVDDGFGMQLGKANGMKNETRERIESPQNYGFTSVVADGDKGANGSLKNSAEAVMNFIGGNRSFPMLQSMDDRRHRLMNLAKDAVKGATAMFGLKEWGQQFLNTEDGMFMTGNLEKKIRTALVQNQNGQKQQQDQASGQMINPAGAVQLADGRVVVKSKSGVEFDVELFANGGGGSSGNGSGGGNAAGGGKSTGQKTLHKEDSDTFHEITKDNHHLRRGDGYVHIEDKKITTYYKDDSKSTRCDDQHVHIGFSGNKVWVDASGCWATRPIRIRNCSDGSGASPPPTAGPAAHSASSPMSIDNNGNLSMNAQAPLSITPNSSGGSTMMAAMTASSVEEFTVVPPTTLGALVLAYDNTLTIDSHGRLSVVGAAGGGGIGEAPTDGLMYGRQGAAWQRALAITGDTLDGGIF